MIIVSVFGGLVRRVVEFVAGPGDQGRLSRLYPRSRLRGRVRVDRPPRFGGRLSFDQIEYLLMDSQVKVAYQIVESLLLSREFTLVRADDSDEAGGVFEFVDGALRGMRVDLRGLRKELYRALLYGFSVNEVLYGFRDGRVVPLDVVPVHPATLQGEDCWVYDEGSGEFLGVRQDLGGSDFVFDANVGRGELIPREKLLIYSFDAAHGLVEGESILREVYDHVDMKQAALRWLLVYLQKYENPVLVGKSANPQYKDELLAALESIEDGLSKITIGRDDDVQVIESSHRGDVFFEFIKYNDNMIFRRFFLGTLIMGQSDSASGSYSQSQTQLEATSLILDGVHMDIAKEIQGLVDRLVAWNFGEDAVRLAPRVGFEPLQEKNLSQVLTTLQPLVKDLVVDPDSQWFQDVLEAYLKNAAGIQVDLSPTLDDDDGGGGVLERMDYDESDAVVGGVASPAARGGGPPQNDIDNVRG